MLSNQILMSRIRTSIVLACYCLLLFLGFDFIYSTFAFGVSGEVRDTPFRTQDARYSHDLTPNFEGFDTWGLARYKFYTNSLGFRDASTRTVSLKPSTYRTLLIGDSFTEGVGVPFEQSFAGLLVSAGQRQHNRIEFLDAGVVSYSPVIYYKKIKTLLAAGLAFDEVVVFLDLSDITDEATSYFCFDDDPKYDAYKVNCPAPGAPRQLSIPLAPPPTFRGRLKAHFVVTARSLAMFNSWTDSLRGLHKQFAVYRSLRADWTIPTMEVGHKYDPLGIEGGIARARNNMQALADLLAAHHIPLTVALYPWPPQLELNDRNSRQRAIWREFCAKNCKSFIDLFPVFFAFKDAHQDWYERLFVEGDVHYSAEGNRLVYQNVADRLLNNPTGQPAADAESRAKESR
jgi:hypothetical protein